METPKESPPRQHDPTYVNAMCHFYRGELGRIMVWRQRLDTTTTWAITTTSTICTLAFSLKNVPHIIFLFNLAIVAIMLWIEARRYRFYDAFRARVRMLEAHFMVPMLMQDGRILQGDWRRLMCEDLILPAFKIGTFEAVGRRLKRNYGFLFAVIQAAWLTKIFLHAPEPVNSWQTFYNALAVEKIPGWAVAGFLIATTTLVIGGVIYISRKSAGEFGEFGPHRKLWRL